MVLLPPEDSTGQFAGMNQIDPNVWFLAGTFGGTAKRSCEIPVRAIFFPLVDDLVSFAECNVPKNQEQLCYYAKDDLDTTSFSEVVVDRIKLGYLEKYRIQSGPFNIVVPVKTQIEELATMIIAVSDGYGVFLKPLSLGIHLI
jgi:hypothetical protein